jgi:transposase-like protein
MLTCAAYPLSLHHIEGMMAERGVFVDHATVHRRAMKIVPAPAPCLPAGMDSRAKFGESRQ